MSTSLRRIAASVITTVMLGAALPFALAAPASAATCPPSTVGGPSVGSVNVGSLSVPIKRFTYPAGGVLDPPPSNQIVGLSARHRPLLSDTGTTVLAWHVRYGPGCPGTLNPLLDVPIGKTFTITAASGKKQAYTVTERTKVKRGAYRPEWFRTEGPAQVVLMTCADPRGGTYTKTTVTVAEPVTDAASGA